MKKLEIPKWEAWDGISDKYQNVLEGMQNTWEPGITGVDERY